MSTRPKQPVGWVYTKTDYLCRSHCVIRHSTKDCVLLFSNIAAGCCIILQHPALDTAPVLFLPPPSLPSNPFIQMLFTRQTHCSHQYSIKSVDSPCGPRPIHFKSLPLLRTPTVGSKTSDEPMLTELWRNQTTAGKRMAGGVQSGTATINKKQKRT